MPKEKTYSAPPSMGATTHAVTVLVSPSQRSVSAGPPSDALKRPDELSSTMTVLTPGSSPSADEAPRNPLMVMYVPVPGNIGTVVRRVTVIRLLADGRGEDWPILGHPRGKKPAVTARGGWSGSLLSSTRPMGSPLVSTLTRGESCCASGLVRLNEIVYTWPGRVSWSTKNCAEEAAGSKEKVLGTPPGRSERSMGAVSKGHPGVMPAGRTAVERTPREGGALAFRRPEITMDALAARVRGVVVDSVTVRVLTAPGSKVECPT
mmetsp:Transcript_22716/g.57480  ORF Transcript_22716/g.57480 Transcript_22716/m.57480 type:complete len:263 (-) Transcript_22716:349-1137(-)